MFQLVDHFYGAENRIDFFAVVGKHDTFFVYQARAIRAKTAMGISQPILMRQIVLYLNR